MNRLIVKLLVAYYAFKYCNVEFRNNVADGGVEEFRCNMIDVKFNKMDFISSIDWGFNKSLKWLFQHLKNPTHSNPEIFEID